MRDPAGIVKETCFIWDKPRCRPVGATRRRVGPDPHAITCKRFPSASNPAATDQNPKRSLQGDASRSLSGSTDKATRERAELAHVL